MKKLLAVLFSFAFVLTGCSSDTQSSTSKNESKVDDHTPETAIQTDAPADPVDLIGTWKQVNSKSDDSYQTVTITADTVTVYWVMDNGDTQSLYWTGTFTAPTSADEPYTWTSNSDHEKMDAAMMASSDDTKDFTYSDGQISYSVSALGTTTTVRAEKIAE